MNRLARSGSTGFQVPPSTLRSEPTIAPSATARKSRTLLDLTPGVREDRRLVATAPLRLADRLHRRLCAGHRARHEDCVGQTRDPHGAGGRRDVSRADARRELGGDVHEHRHVCRVQLPTVAKEPSRIRRPEPHVGFVDAGHDLSDERGARHGRDGQRRLRVPEVVDSERSVPRCHLRDNASHHGDAFEGCLQLVRAITLVAEENAVEPGAGEDLDVSPHGLDDPVRPAGLVVERCARHRREVRHRDGRLLDSEELIQVARHCAT